MTNMDKELMAMVDEVNRELPPPKVLTVTNDNVKRVAQSMARLGYRFEVGTLQLVREFLLDKGLLLTGDVGTGKSFFFYCLGVPCLNLKIAQSKELKEIVRALDEHADRAILVDDIGVEELSYMSYGTSVRLLDLILEKRVECPMPTHFTTNLTIEGLKERYGARVVDRMRGMAKVATLRGGSNRDIDAPKLDYAWMDDFWKPRLWRVCANCCGHYDAEERRCIKGKTVEPSSVRRAGYDPEPRCPYYHS